MKINYIFHDGYKLEVPEAAKKFIDGAGQLCLRPNPYRPLLHNLIPVGISVFQISKERPLTLLDEKFTYADGQFALTGGRLKVTPEVSRGSSSRDLFHIKFDHEALVGPIPGLGSFG